jgi:hypothetical protein
MPYNVSLKLESLYASHGNAHRVRKEGVTPIMYRTAYSHFLNDYLDFQPISGQRWQFLPKAHCWENYIRPMRIQKWLINRHTSADNPETNRGGFNENAIDRTASLPQRRSNTVSHRGPLPFREIFAARALGNKGEHPPATPTLYPRSTIRS